MAQTVDAINACGAVVELDDVDGEAVNISGQSNQANLKFTKQIGKGVTFEGEWNFALECKKDASLELRVMWTTNSAEARKELEDWYQSGGRRTVSVYPNGLINGSRYYTGLWRLSELSFNIDATDANPIMMQATLMPDGEVSFSTFVS
jgi:hypothetical protein